MAPAGDLQGVERLSFCPMTRDTSKRKNRSKPPADAEYAIDDLARKAGMTVRNVRAYQERGLLPPPERRGRRGVYSQIHLSRLRIIGQMLERGYTLANIDELLKAWEQGQDLSQLLGLETAITSPWSEEPPGYFTRRQLLKMFGMPYTPSSLKTLNRVVDLGLLEREGNRYRAFSPRIIHAGAELVSMGISLNDLLDIVRSLRVNVETVADKLVQLVLPLIDRYGNGKLPPPEEVSELADLIWRLRPLAQVAVSAEVDRAMEHSANKFFGDRLAYILDHLHDDDRKQDIARLAYGRQFDQD